jgi:hypothetical protein
LRSEDNLLPKKRIGGEGETVSHPFTDFLRERGEGAQHLGFEVNDLDGMLTKLAKEGIDPLFRVTLPDVALAFLNTDKIGGVQFELIEMKGKQG